MLSSTNVYPLAINNLAQLGAHIRCLRIITAYVQQHISGIWAANRIWDIQ